VDDDDKIGRILVRMAACAPAELEAALAAQRAGDARNVGALLGASEADIKVALEVQALLKDGRTLEGAMRMIEAAHDRAASLLDDEGGT
jgi:hypothetical protein